uniref:SASA domain-containing protein n=1 Tax=Heterorhabditis bacteriophora TaxID=37862 RepID=A0A1I7WRD6_HETBA
MSWQRAFSAFLILQSLVSSLVIMLVIDIVEQMIIFDAPLESWVDKNIKIHCAKKNPNVNNSTYFLIGSFCSDGDINIAHTTKCPLPVTAGDPEGDQLSQSFDDEWIADNAEKITRILPGGVHVVGVAWFSREKISMDQRNMLSRALARIQRTTNSLTTLNLGTVSDSMVLHIYTYI